MPIRETLQALAPLLWTVAILFVVTRTRLIRRLTRGGAFDEASAKPLAGRGLPGFWRRRLVTAGVLRSTDGARFWLDRPAWEAYMRVRRRRGLTVGITLAAALLAFAALAVWR